MRTAAAAPDPDDSPEYPVRTGADQPWNRADWRAVLDQTLAEVEQYYARRGKSELYAALKPALWGRLTKERTVEIEKQFGLSPVRQSMAIVRIRSRVQNMIRRTLEP